MIVPDLCRRIEVTKLALALLFLYFNLLRPSPPVWFLSLGKVLGLFLPRGLSDILALWLWLQNRHLDMTLMIADRHLVYRLHHFHWVLDSRVMREVLDLLLRRWVPFEDRAIHMAVRVRRMCVARVGNRVG